MRPVYIVMALVAFMVIAAITYWQTVERTGGGASVLTAGRSPLVVTDVITPKQSSNGFSGVDTISVVGERDSIYDAEADEADVADPAEDQAEADGLIPLDGASLAMKASYGFLQPGDRVRKINGIEVRNAREAYLVLQALNQPAAPTIVFDVDRIGMKGKYEPREALLDRSYLGSLELKGAGGKKVNTEFPATCQHLLWAAQEGNAVSVEQLLKRGMKDCLDERYPTEHERGQTALLAAVQSENLGVARLLLKYGANVDGPDTNGTTPLMRAAEIGNRELVVLLLAEGADVRARNNELRAAADVADAQGFRDIADVIENPSPRAFLPNDQRVKVPELLAAQNLISPKNKYHSDAELSKAIKEWQLGKGLAPTGMLTRDQFEKLRRDTKRFATKYDNAREERETVTTLRRMDGRFFNRNWSVVDTRFGVAECEKETVLFQLSPDGKEITMKTYRPGTSLGDLDFNSVKPTREATYKVERATIENDRDIIVVRNSASSFATWKYQTWEIGPSTISIASMKSLKESEEAKRGAVLATCR